MNELKRMLPWLWLCLQSLAWAGSPAPVTEPKPVDPPAALMRTLQDTFSTIRTVKTRFTQTKELKIFSRPVVIEGHLALKNPGRLAWRVDRPVRYALVIRNGEAVQWDEDTRRIQKLPFAGNPVFETVISQIEQWFSGDFSALAEGYDVEIMNASPPRLAFTPHADRMESKAIRLVTISVREDLRYVEQIVIDDVSGDRTTIDFHATVLNEPLADDEWEVAPHDP